MIIPNTNAGSQQLVYVSTVPGWTGGSTIRIRKRDSDRPIYACDIWNLQPNSRLIQAGNRIWSPLWLSDYKDNAGDNVYNPLETGFAISKIYQSIASNQTYSVDFSFSPLVPKAITPDAVFNIEVGVMPYEKQPPTWNGEYCIYYMSAYPLYPLLVTNTIPINNKYCGPLFIKSLNFDCDCSETGNKVLASVSLQGGKYFTYNQSVADSNDYEYDELFRSANFADCFCFLESDIESDNEIAPSFDGPLVMKMSLRIDQTIESTYPSHKTGTDDKGARFISLKSRSVTGSVTVLSPDEFTDLSLYTKVTMYFGGPFYYPMYNIKWQKPSASIKVDDGYIYTYPFIALADPNAAMSSLLNAAGQTISEFNIAFGSL